MLNAPFYCPAEKTQKKKYRTQIQRCSSYISIFFFFLLYQKCVAIKMTEILLYSFFFFLSFVEIISDSNLFMCYILFFCKIKKKKSPKKIPAAKCLNPSQTTQIMNEKPSEFGRRVHYQFLLNGHFFSLFLFAWKSDANAVKFTIPLHRVTGPPKYRNTFKRVDD